MTWANIRRGIEREKIPTAAAYQRQFLPQFLTRCQNQIFRLTLKAIAAPIPSVNLQEAQNVFDFGTARAQDGPRLAVWQLSNAGAFRAEFNYDRLARSSSTEREDERQLDTSQLTRPSRCIYSHFPVADHEGFWRIERNDNGRKENSKIPAAIVRGIPKAHSLD
jgi:hypothetical protein